MVLHGRNSANGACYTNMGRASVNIHPRDLDNSANGARYTSMGQASVNLHPRDLGNSANGARYTSMGRSPMYRYSNLIPTSSVRRLPFHIS